QTPLVGILTTFFIGQAVFEEQPTWGQVITACRQTFWRSIWVLGVLRGPLPAMAVLLLFWGGRSEESVVAVNVLIGLITAVAMLVRMLRPYLAEILLLERCPLRRSPNGPLVMTAGMRSKNLHGPLSGDLFLRAMLVSFATIALVASMFNTLIFFRGVLFGQWSWDFWTLFFLVPISLWVISCVSIFVKFLGYLDARIKLEGWEVELALRAERIRQFGVELSRPKAERDAIVDGSSTVVPNTAQGGARRIGTNTAGLIGILMLSICLASPAVAQDAESSAFDPPETAADVDPDAANDAGAQALRSLGNNVWYDADEDGVRPVGVVPRDIDSQHRDSRWRPRAAKIRQRKRTGTVNSQGGTTGLPGVPSLFGLSLVAWGVIFLLFTGMITLIVFILSRFEITEQSAAPRRGTNVEDEDEEKIRQERIQELPEELRIRGGDLRSQAEYLAQQERYDEAIIALYGHQLLLLDRQTWLYLSRGKTNGRYLRETRQSNAEAGQVLGQTINAFEASYFGGYPVQKEHFAALWDENSRLEKILADANVGGRR
ncbi:MAG: DUF4129 domain-containing protein, partial [Planctomycetota bacterium]